MVPPGTRSRRLRLVLAGLPFLLGGTVGCGTGDDTDSQLLPTSPEMHAGHKSGAEIFAPGVISDSREQWRITFTPNGKTAYFASSDEFFPFTRQGHHLRLPPGEQPVDEAQGRALLRPIQRH